jgi:CRISPR-associated protein Cas2
MRIVITYDVSTVTKEGRRRLRKVAQTCKNFGVRVQFSVFECSVGDRQWVRLRDRLLSILEPEEDSLRFYFLSADDALKTEHHGVRKPLDVDGPLLV